MSSKPRYWDTDNGKVLKAIVTSEHRTRSEIRNITGFTDDELNQILADLFISDLISKTGSSYWIEDYNLFCEYRDYIQGNYDSEYLRKEQQEKREQLKSYVDITETIREYLKENKYESTVIENTIWWTVRENIRYYLYSEHFFIEGELLDRLCKDVIDFSREQVIVVNPFVDQCSLSDKLKTSSVKGKDITLLTRSPENERNQWVKESRRAYHNVLLQNGVKLLYNDRIHSKIIVSDGVFGIVSSMNFKSESSSGKNLEAGIVTWEEETILSLNKYIENLLQDFETITYGGE